MRILLVDDEKDLRDITSERLESAGFDVLRASDGYEALALLRHPDQVDVLFTDVVMPGMNGIDLAQKARADHRGLRVVLTSGYAPPEAKLPEGTRFIPKPYRFSDLLTALRRAN